MLPSLGSAYRSVRIQPVVLERLSSISRVVGSNRRVERIDTLTILLLRSIRIAEFLFRPVKKAG